MTQPAKLALEDGTVFTGTSFGAAGEVDGEVCFNTSMTGYQEILTDPSYRGQIVTMTYPQIGNYGVNAEDVESAQARTWPASSSASAAAWPSNFRSQRHARRATSNGTASSASKASTPGPSSAASATRGAMKGVLSTADLDDASLVAKAKASPGLVGRDLVREVMPAAAARLERAADQLAHWKRAADGEAGATRSRRLQRSRRRPRLRHEVEHRPPPGATMGCRVTVLPGTATADEVLAPQARRRLPLQRPRRPRAARLRHRHHPRRARQEAGLRHLPRPSAARRSPAAPRPSSSSSATAAPTSRC